MSKHGQTGLLTIMCLKGILKNNLVVCKKFKKKFKFKNN